MRVEALKLLVSTTSVRTRTYSENKSLKDIKRRKRDASAVAQAAHLAAQDDVEIAAPEVSSLLSSPAVSSAILAQSFIYRI